MREWSLIATWTYSAPILYYLKNGHRWILHFENGKVAQLQTQKHAQ